jgi:hypothetical protein
MRRLIMLALLCTTLLSASGCAVVNSENRYASRAVESMWPESVPAQVVVAPVLVPLWAGGLVVDALVVNPVMSLPKALFTAFGINGMVPALPVVEIVVFPLRVITFPLLVLGAEIVYCTVPL